MAVVLTVAASGDILSSMIIAPGKTDNTFKDLTSLDNPCIACHPVKSLEVQASNESLVWENFTSVYKFG